jgi:hypothetical protein
VFLAHVGDVGAGGFDDSQTEQPKHGDEGAIVWVARPTGGGEHCLELQVDQAEGG